MNDTEPRTGYELAKKILDTHRGDAIETMLRCSHGTESDWLEFKAGMTLLPEDEKKGWKPDDLYWTFAKSIVAMVNTSGGAFVIGVDNKHNPVPLSQCDPRHIIENDDVEAYIRKEILDRIAPDGSKPQSWTDSKGVTWSIEERLSPFIESRQVNFHNETVVVLLVKPCEMGKELLVLRREKGAESDQLPYRKSGDVGSVEVLSRYAVIKKYPEIRQRDSDRFVSLFGQAAPALFVCHASKDEKIAKWFSQRLEENGIPCWFAPNSLKGGNRWLDSIDDAIDASTSLLVLVSENSLNSDWVPTEVMRAFKAKKRIIPVEIDGCQFETRKGGLSLILSNFHKIDASASREESIGQIVKAIHQSFGSGATQNESISTKTRKGTLNVPKESPPVANGTKTKYDKLIVAFKQSVTPNQEGVRPILDILNRSPMPNVDTPTFGGHFWWEPIAESHGWKLQQNKLFNQLRILDDKGFRRAWGWRRGMERMFSIERTLNHTKNPAMPLSPPVEAPPPRLGKAMYFRSIANGRIVTARDAGRGPLAAEVNWTRAWEMFALHENEDGTVSFSAECNGKYVTVRFDQDVRYLEASAETIDLWEKFHVEESDGIYLVKTAKEGFYVQADILNGGVLCAKERTPDTWERFNAFSVVMTNPELPQP